MAVNDQHVARHMRHHSVFSEFRRATCIGTGRHVFDFLGAATDVTYKKDWKKHALKRGAKYTPDYPVVNEHYFDWIALLKSIRSASGIFRMAELGAGWAPWLVRAAFATRQLPAIRSAELLGIEADPTHYAWMNDHFLDNEMNPDDYHLIHGAVSPDDMIVKFPRVNDPDCNYGASLLGVTHTSDYLEVQGYSMKTLLSRFSGPVDFIHMDIQGAEYQLFPDLIGLLSSQVKSIMVGTHLSLEKHSRLRDLFDAHEWIPILIYPRHARVDTEFGTVQFDDGILFYRNRRFFER